jgi:hypothetical protein
MMSHSRFQAIHAGMTAVAKKVYSAVPMAECWSTPRIVNELQRLGISHEFRVISGCLGALLEAGLVNEPVKGQYRREPVRDSTPPKAEPEPEPKEAMKPAEVFNLVKPALPAEKNPVDKLGVLAARIISLADSLKQLAGDVSDAAIEIQTQTEENEAASQKLKQLQALLKGLG